MLLEMEETVWKIFDNAGAHFFLAVEFRSKARFESLLLSWIRERKKEGRKEGRKDSFKTQTGVDEKKKTVQVLY